MRKDYVPAAVAPDSGMVRKERENGQEVYYCEICDHGYSDGETAQRCHNFCSTHAACSLEITRNAIRRPKF